MQARRITLSMNGSFAGSFSIQHVRMDLIMLTAATPSQAAKVLWPALGSFKCSQRDENPSQQKRVNKRTDAEHHNRTNRHGKYNTPHPRKDLHNKVAGVHVRDVPQWIEVAIHDAMPSSGYKTRHLSSPEPDRVPFCLRSRSFSTLAMATDSRRRSRSDAI